MKKNKKVNNKKIYILVLIICLISIFVIKKSIILLNKENFEEEDSSWQAKYIWFADERNLSDDIKQNEWACFRKTINIDDKKNIKNVVAKIAVDSKYWLYINGEILIKEGGLKRGQKPNSIYYDEVCLDKYLNKGENTIAILVWYYGRNSFSHITSQNGAVLFQTKIGDQLIISDSTWKAIKNPAFKKDVPIINTRLSEENIFYDATEDLGQWYKNDYDDKNWKNAVELGSSNNIIWGELIARNIPFFEHSEILEYENSKQFDNQIFEKDTLLELKLPYNMQVLPYFKIESVEGKIINITIDEEYYSLGKEHKVIYITKNGLQEFESPSWINGEKIYYFIPKGVKIIKLGYRQTNYKIENTGSFSANDPFYEKLWEKAYNTLRVNMRDNYMDCPDRERAQWWGDTSISMEEAIYSLDQNANDLYIKGVKTMLGWKHDDILLTIAPSNEANSMHLPIQMLLGIVSMYDYYLYTGDIEFLKLIYPHVKSYLYMWEIEPSGLASYPAGFVLWRWEDSSGDCDYIATENIWYYYAITKLYDMAITLDKQEDLIPIEERKNNLYISINERLKKDFGYREWQIEKYDIRANAVAILAGLADEEMYENITKIILEDKETSPFMEKYVIEALCKMDKIEEAQKRMKEQYKNMVDNEFSTLGEYFDEKTGSKNHSWSGGPIIIMQKYFAGISPSNPGFTEINLKPRLGNLKNISSKVNTISGTIKLNVTKSDNEINMEINTPVKTRVAIEKLSNNPKLYLNNWCVYKNGKSRFNFIGKYETEDENYLYYFVEKGSYKIKVN